MIGTDQQLVCIPSNSTTIIPDKTRKLAAKMLKIAANEKLTSKCCGQEKIHHIKGGAGDSDPD